MNSIRGALCPVSVGTIDQRPTTRAGDELHGGAPARSRHRGSRRCSRARSAGISSRMAVRILHCHSTFSPGGKEARAVRLMNAFGAAATHTILSAMPGRLEARAAIAPGIAAEFPGDAPPLAGRPGPGRLRALARYMRGFDLVLTYNWGAFDAVMARRL